MRLHEIVKAYEQWHDKNFPLPDANRSLQKFTEEVGELNAAVYRQDHEAMVDSLGDCFFALLGCFKGLHVESKPAIEAVWNDIKDRDYKNHPRTGSAS